MKTLIESANRYLTDDSFDWLSEEELTEAKRMLKEGFALWHVKYDNAMKLVNADSIQELIDQMSSIKEFQNAKSISFSRMNSDSL